MRDFLAGVGSFFRAKLEAAASEAALLGQVAADVGSYAVRRYRDRHGDVVVGLEPVVEIANRIIVEAANRLIEAKKHVAVAIADEKSLVKQAEQRDADAGTWSRRAAEAEAAGLPELAVEARDRERACREEVERLQEQFHRQRAVVGRLKSELRAYNDRIEDAKRSKHALSTRLALARARWTVQENARWLDHALRVLDSLVAIDGSPRERPGEPDGPGPANGTSN